MQLPKARGEHLEFVRSHIQGQKVLQHPDRIGKRLQAVARAAEPCQALKVQNLCRKNGDAIAIHAEVSECLQEQDVVEFVEGGIQERERERERREGNPPKTNNSRASCKP